jgi:hypothetical protein
MSADPYGAAHRADIAADRALRERLEAADARGDLTTHYDEKPCAFGLWHEGPCPTGEATS